MARSLTEARAAAEEEARLRETGESLWTPERLRVSIQTKNLQSSLFVVSNREPYMHVLSAATRSRVIVPASGLVTALEPILRACDGTWIAFGSGDADRRNGGPNDRLRVPPGQAGIHHAARLAHEGGGRRVLLRIFERRPLAALPHRPHASDFSRFGLAELPATPTANLPTRCWKRWRGRNTPCCSCRTITSRLLPRMIKEARPDARVAIFWHIPWPNPEAFGICPWQRELLDGLLGADLVGFHTQAHCNNFLETVDAALESRIEWERFAVKRHGHTTFVRPFPISVAFPRRTADRIARREAHLTSCVAVY